MNRPPRRPEPPRRPAAPTPKADLLETAAELLAETDGFSVRDARALFHDFSADELLRAISQLLRETL
jgi:hypothetical protein